MPLITKACEIYREKGMCFLLRRTVHFGYFGLLRPRFPYTAVDYNGVIVRNAKLFDRYVPGQRADRPNYESGVVDALERHVDAGDSVVVIGGGWGVTAVRAARKTGAAGSVVVYEASKEMTARVAETLALNGVEDRVDLTNAVVGHGVDVWGEATDDVVHPSELPECDVLVLDCEGAEVDVLVDMAIDPRVIAVETHGLYDAPSNEVAALLEERGYTVTNRTVADRGLEETCREADIRVLTAVR
jgi:hypothetical protein